MIDTELDDVTSCVDDEVKDIKSDDAKVEKKSAKKLDKRATRRKLDEIIEKRRLRQEFEECLGMDSSFYEDDIFSDYYEDES